MDKETIELVEAVRRSLVDYQKTVEGSVLKKTRKVTSQIIWSADEYLDELDNIKSTSKTDAEAIERIRSLVRSSEQRALDTMTVLPDDTGHHLVQSRTGGDPLTEIPYQRSGPIIQRLSEKHQRTFGNTMGPQGNLPPEMSLSNFAHKADDRATGLERESGLGKNPDKATTAHAKGTAGYANMKGVDMSSDAAIEADLDIKVGEQIEQGRIAAQTDAPRQQFLREASGNPQLYKGPVPGNLELDRNVILRSYDALRPGLKNAAAFLGKIPIKGAVGGAIISGAKPGFADVGTLQKATQGDIGGVAADVGVGAVTGGVVELGLQGAQRISAGLANVGRFLYGNVAGPALTGTAIAGATFTDPKVQKRYAEAEPGLDSLRAAFSNFIPKTDKVEKSSPNRSERRGR